MLPEEDMSRHNPQVVLVFLLDAVEQVVLLQMGRVALPDVYSAIQTVAEAQGATAPVEGMALRVLLEV